MGLLTIAISMVLLTDVFKFVSCTFSLYCYWSYLQIFKGLFFLMIDSVSSSTKRTTRVCNQTTMSVSIRLQGRSTAFSWRWKEFNYSKVKFESRSITNNSNFPPASNFPHSSVISEKFTSSLWTSRSQTWGELLENKLTISSRFTVSLNMCQQIGYRQYWQCNLNISQKEKRFTYNITSHVTKYLLSYTKKLWTPMYEYINMLFNKNTSFLYSYLFHSFRVYF